MTLKKILLIDDDKDLGELVRRKIREAIEKVFVGWGVEMADARTWEDGSRLASSGEFDVVLLDLAGLPANSSPLSPVTHTNDIIAMIPRVSAEWPCPIIIFTGNKSDEVRDKCIAFGAAGYFLKCILIFGTGGGEALLQDCQNAVLLRRRQGI